MSILKFLGLSPDSPQPAASTPETETVRKIVQRLGSTGTPACALCPKCALRK